MKELARFVRSVLTDHFPDIPGPKIPVFTIPGPVAEFLGKMNLVINSQQAVMGNSYYIDSSKAKKELGYQHPINDLRGAAEEVLNSIFFLTE